MRRQLTLALLLLLPAPFGVPQQIIPPTPPADAVAPTQPPEPTMEIPPARLYKIGGRVSAPVVKHSVAAQYTDKAKQAHYQGACLIGLTVDTHGKPQNIHVVRALGMGLDENAIDAVRQYKFKPAMKDGKTPVPVMITIEVDFKLY